MTIDGRKRYALLLAAKDSDYVKKVYGGYFNVYVGAYGEEGDKWDLFRVVEGEFPDMNELHKYTGFVVSGSPFDAFGNDSWIVRLCFLLETLVSMGKRVLGICFGHQVLCRALGGKIRRSRSGWDIGLGKVRFMEELPPHSFLNVLKGNPPFLSVIQCHQDEVWEVPLGAKVIAFSEKTGVEMFSMGDHVLGIQGHPEYTKDILFNLIDRLVNNNSIERDFAEDVRSRMEIAEPDTVSWEIICKSFLKGR